MTRWLHGESDSWLKPEGGGAGVDSLRAGVDVKMIVGGGTAEAEAAKAVVFDHSTPGKPRLLVSIWPATIQNFKWHILVDPHSLL